jgi:hypothetical protein
MVLIVGDSDESHLHIHPLPLSHSYTYVFKKLSLRFHTENLCACPFSSLMDRSNNIGREIQNIKRLKI